ncbi:HEAT repeat domain-containing protein [Pseudoalteromonas tunicata]|uniref:HEAT repeat domain-containing protein n=1 Tax=Pseudoalteromonas tunicata TaxID=314281 RepID=UPI00273FA12A|nr:HEAT repeat domain-containing protein [Pseudoalteromonas tunicata]MDP5211949.1 HEAT repeat domain-containing protein [Pseudoalteromonas tunicata]
MALIMETPANIEDLIKNANCKHCWKTRFSALEELRKYDCQQSRDVITRLALHDKVFKVKEEAVRVTQAFGITKNGKPISLGKKDTGFKAKDFTKLFLRVKREKKIEVFNLEIFKAGFKEVNPEMYDVMSFDKGSKFDSWIENSFTGLPKK